MTKDEKAYAKEMRAKRQTTHPGGDLGAISDAIHTVKKHEWVGHAWNDQHHCSKCGQPKSHPNHE